MNLMFLLELFGVGAECDFKTSASVVAWMVRIGLGLVAKCGPYGYLSSYSVQRHRD